MVTADNTQKGFTLVELVVVIVVFGLVSLAIASLFISIQDVQDQAAYIETATRAAQVEVESLRNNNYNQLTDGQTLTFAAPSSLPAPRSGNVTISEPVVGVKRVDVTVAYTFQGTARDIELSSTIGIIGISQ